MGEAEANNNDQVFSRHCYCTPHRLARALRVRDTTWEERTWKELMKLKEDMFWAPIGAVR